MRKILVVFISSFISLFALSQDFSNKGKDFWVGYGYHQVMTQGGNAQDMVLYFATDQVANVTVSIPLLGYSATYNNIAANTVFQTPTLPKAGGTDSRLFTEGLSNKGIHITSDVPIVAYAHIYNSSVSGATVLYPVPTLGKSYYSVNYTNNSNSPAANCWFYVVAVDTGTTAVSIIPSAQTQNWSAGSTNVVTLTQGQVYNVMGTVSGNNGVDLTGSIIESIASGTAGCKRIAVFSGSGRIAIACNGTVPSSDNYMVQGLPKTAWGKNFLTTPSASYSSTNGTAPPMGNMYRVCVTDPTTVVTVDGAPITVPLIGGFYYELTQSASFRKITADKPIMVAQYFPSQGNTGCGIPSGDGDPEVIYLSPIEQSISTVRWDACNNFAINPQKHYINVIIPNGGTAISSCRLDGASLPAGTFTVHPQNPAYAYAILRVSGAAGVNVPHVLVSDSGFNAIAYGYGTTESYGYNAGTNVKDLYSTVGTFTPLGTESGAVCQGISMKFKLSLLYQPDSLYWDLRGITNTPQYGIEKLFTPLGSFDSTTTVNGKTLYWYSLTGSYIFNTPGSYTVPITVFTSNGDGCGNQQQKEMTFEVDAPPTPDFLWLASGCPAETMQFNDITISTKPTYKWSWDFGDPASPNPTATSKNPTHLFTHSGPFTVTFHSVTTPGCVSNDVKHLITIPDLPTATINGSTTVCLNAAAPNITITGTGGLAPYNFTYTVNNGTPIIVTSNATGSYTVPVPTIGVGTFKYDLLSVKNSNSTICINSVSGQSATVTVSPYVSLSLTSTPAYTDQTFCVNSPLPNNIVYQVSAGGTGVTAIGLPMGVAGAYSGGVYTISGTPTVSGNFTYSLSPLGGCPDPSNPPLTGTLHVTANATLALDGSSNNNPIVCVNNPIPSIVYNIGGGATNAALTWTATPAPGITAAYDGVTQKFTIQGTPTAAGVYPFSVATVSTCINPPPLTGTITVNADASISLTSLPSTTIQTKCVNAAINTISYSISGSVTSVTVSPLPTGVTYSYTPGSPGTLTILGTPTVATVGPLQYTVTIVGPCQLPTAMQGTLNITPDAAIALQSGSNDNQAVCVNVGIGNIIYSISGTVTAVTVTNLPAGVTYLYTPGSGGNPGFVLISGTPTVAGPFNYQVNVTGPCLVPPPTKGTITVNPLPTPNFSFSIPTCNTRTITFTDNSLPNAGTLTGWAWTFGDPGSGANNTSTLQNPTHEFSGVGPFTVGLTPTTSNGCSNAAPFIKIVQVNERPHAEFNVPTLACVSDIVSFSDASTFGSGVENSNAYKWDFGDLASVPSNIQNAKNGTHQFSAGGTYTVTHISGSQAGCLDTISHPITISSIAIADFSVANSAALCVNDTVAITNLSTIAVGNITKLEIYWDALNAPGTAIIDNAPALNKVYKHKYPNFQSPGNKPYTILVRAFSGVSCTNDKPRLINVNAVPKVQFNAMPNACYDAAPFQINQASETGGVTGTGNYSGIGVSPTGLFSPKVAGIGTHSIKFTFTSIAGCVDTMSSNITVLDTSSAKFSYATPVCDGNAVVFKDESISPAGVIISGSICNLGDGNTVNVAPGASFTHTYATWGTYTVTMYNTSTNGCKSTVYTQQVTVHPIPQPAFAFVQSTVCLPNAAVSFINTSSIADNSGITYQWDFGDVASGPLNSSTAKTPPPHIYSGTGPYTVKLIVNGATGTNGSCMANTSHLVNFIHPQPKASFVFDKPTICIGDNVTVTDKTNGLDGSVQQWFWDFGDNIKASTNQVQHLYTTPQTYGVSLYIVNSQGCNSDTLTQQFEVNAYPVVDAGPDRVVLEGGSITMQPVVAGNNLQYLWSPSTYLNDVTLAAPTANIILTDIRYTLTVTGRGGCTAPSDNLFVKVLKAPQVPNTFTPNGDGINDVWAIDYLSTYPDCRVQVFTRSGQMVFESRGYKTPWDGTIKGKPLPFDTYYYILEPGNGRPPSTGYVTIVK